MRRTNGPTVLLELKGFEDAQTKAKHDAAGRWVEALTHAREHGRWEFHVCRDPQLLEQQLVGLLDHGGSDGVTQSASGGWAVAD